MNGLHGPTDRHVGSAAYKFPEGDPVEVQSADSRAESQSALNGPSGSPTSPSGRASAATRRWKAGDECRLVNLKIGVVLDGKIEVVRGHKMVVQTDDGQRWTANVDSSFVQVRT